MMIVYRQKKCRHGPSVYSSLYGDAREAVYTVDPTELKVDDGFKKIIAALDAVYLTDENTCAFCAVKSFVEFH